MDHVEEMCLESPRKMQDERVRLRGMRRGWREEDAWRLEPEGERETLETKVVSNGVEGVHVNPNGEGHHEREQVKSSTWEGESPGGGEEIKSPKQ